MFSVVSGADQRGRWPVRRGSLPLSNTELPKSENFAWTGYSTYPKHVQFGVLNTNTLSIFKSPWIMPQAWRARSPRAMSCIREILTADSKSRFWFVLSYLVRERTMGSIFNKGQHACRGHREDTCLPTALMFTIFGYGEEVHAGGLEAPGTPQCSGWDLLYLDPTALAYIYYRILCHGAATGDPAHLEAGSTSQVPWLGAG